MSLLEKNTMSGEDLRTYLCRDCHEEHEVNLGTAFWKLMSDANKREGKD